MASNSFGELFRITTWGESHGPAIGVVIDGCPAGLALNTDIINAELAYRAPGNSPHTSPRKEADQVQILSGVFEQQTTGAPISLIIYNRDADSSKYEAIKDIYRPGHANFTYDTKYGVFDYRGGGRASARETACRVAAGAVAKALLAQHNITIISYIQQIGAEKITSQPQNLNAQQIYHSDVYCPDQIASDKMVAALTQAQQQGDSLGGVVALEVQGLPVGLGDPVYQKLEAKLANAMLSIPASKGFSIGAGFNASQMRGSEHNDQFTLQQDRVTLSSNQAGGTLGGISNGQALTAAVAFKPTSSIKPAQNSVTRDGQACEFRLPKGSRHDPCVAIRAVPVVSAMAALVIADSLLLNRVCQC
jgi:chorismate synthase